MLADNPERERKRKKKTKTKQNNPPGEQQRMELIFQVSFSTGISNMPFSHLHMERAVGTTGKETETGVPTDIIKEEK